MQHSAPSAPTYIHKRTDLHLGRGCPDWRLGRALDPLTEKSFELPEGTGPPLLGVNAAGPSGMT